MAYTGEIASLGAAFCWTWTAVFFTSAGSRIGSFAVNVIRLTFAVPLLVLMTIVAFGTDFAAMFEGGNIPLLMLSGLVGLTLGDAALFRAFILIGPRKSTLIFSTTPIVTGIAAWFTLS